MHPQSYHPRHSFSLVWPDFSELESYLYYTISKQHVLIKPLIFCIERRDADIHDFHFSDCPVSAAGLDKDSSKWLDRDFFAVQLHLAGAFENEVDFGQLFMIMHPRIGLDINDVHSSGGIVRYGERPFSKAAGTFDRVNLVKTCYHVVCHRYTISFKLLNSQPARCIFCLKCMILSRTD